MACYTFTVSAFSTAAGRRSGTSFFSRLEEGDEVLRLPGQVAHVSAGLRPRLGIRFEPLEQGTLSSLIHRLGRRAELTASGGWQADGERDLRFVLLEPGKADRRPLEWEGIYHAQGRGHHQTVQAG